MLHRSGNFQAAWIARYKGGLISISPEASVRDIQCLTNKGKIANKSTPRNYLSKDIASLGGAIYKNRKSSTLYSRVRGITCERELIT